MFIKYWNENFLIYVVKYIKNNFPCFFLLVYLWLPENFQWHMWLIFLLDSALQRDQGFQGFQTGASPPCPCWRRGQPVTSVQSPGHLLGHAGACRASLQGNVPGCVLCYTTIKLVQIILSSCWKHRVCQFYHAPACSSCLCVVQIWVQGNEPSCSHYRKCPWSHGILPHCGHKHRHQNIDVAQSE